MSNTTKTTKTTNTKWKVYKLVSPDYRVYIGCTHLPLETRFQNGRGYKNNKELFDDIILYGWNNFKAYQIAEYEDEHLAREREHAEIKKYPDGYNRYRGISPRPTTGQPKTPPKRVLCLETGVTYDSIYQAAQQTGLAKNKISYCCRGIRNKTGGFHWKFV